MMYSLTLLIHHQAFSGFIFQSGLVFHKCLTRFPVGEHMMFEHTCIFRVKISRRFFALLTVAKVTIIMFHFYLIYRALVIVV